MHAFSIVAVWTAGENASKKVCDMRFQTKKHWYVSGLNFHFSSEDTDSPVNQGFHCKLFQSDKIDN